MAITYTPTTNFGAKDSLPTNDPDKVIKGSEFTTEFTALQTAFSLAAPNASPTFTGTVTIASVDINGGTIDGVTIGGSSAGAITGTTGQFNTSLNVDGTVTADGGTIVSTGSDAFLAKAVGGYAIQAYQDATSSGHTALDLRSDATTGTRYLIRGYNDAAGTPTEVFSVGADGTVTADGLTVDGDGLFKALAANATPLKVFSGNSATNSTTTIEIGDYTGGGVFETPRASLVASRDGASAGGVLTVTTGNTSAGTLTNRLNIASNGDISFYEDTGTTAKFFWDASAEALGLGTSSVTAKLDILGSQAINGFDVGAILREGLTNTSSSYLVLGDQQGVALRGVHTGTFGRKALAFYTSNNTDSGDFDPEERMRIDSAGRVGIGTSSPQTLLDVSEFGGTPTIRITNSDGTFTAGQDIGKFEFFCSDASSPGARVASYILSQAAGTQGGGDLQFATSANAGTVTERMRIDSSGNVGIGTSSPSSFSSLANNLVVNSSTNSGITISESTGSGSSNILFAATSGFANRGNISYDHSATAMTFGINATEAMRIDSSGRVGIGTTPSNKLDVGSAADPAINMSATADGILRLSGGGYSFAIANNDTGTFLYNNGSSRAMVFGVNETERMRLDASGNFLVGTTTTIGTTDTTGSGHDFRATGAVLHKRDGGTVQYLNRLTSDGDILDFRKDGSSVGSIGVQVGGLEINGNPSATTTLRFGTGSTIYPTTDNVGDIGASGNRFDDIYATNGTIQTSDRNEKENIRELLEAEARVAQAAKGLLRAFQWKDSVAEKGDDARIHFGIIAQDLQAAFEAEGLDAGRYAMFIHSTWTDEETGEERSRMGVRYSELLAFIIAAL